MNRARIRYCIVFCCVLASVALITYKFTQPQKTQTQIYPNNIGSTNTKTGEQTDINTNITQTSQQQGQSTNQTIRNDLSTSIPGLHDKVQIVKHGSNLNLLINAEYIIPLPTNMYSGHRTGVVQLSDNPLMIYYRYELDQGGGYSFIYDITKNTSRNLDRLTLIGKMGNAYIFSIKQETDFYGISVMTHATFQTIYTGTFTQAQYLGNMIKITDTKEIYLPIITSGF